MFIIYMFLDMFAIMYNICDVNNKCTHNNFSKCLICHRGDYNYYIIM